MTDSLKAEVEKAAVECGPGLHRCTGGYDGLDEPMPCPNHLAEEEKAGE